MIRLKELLQKKLIEIKGIDYIKKNKDNFTISYSEDKNNYFIAFLVSKSSDYIGRDIYNDETPIMECLFLSVNKKTFKCEVIENTL